MSPDYFEKSKNVCIIYPGGTGGNHLANLLSLNEIFNSRYPYKLDTYELLKTFYFSQQVENKPMHTIHAHLPNHPGHASTYYKSKHYQIIKNIENKKTIFTGHCFNFEGLNNSLYESPIYLENISYIIMNFPSANSFAYKRILSIGHYDDVNVHRYEFPYKVHSMPTDNKIIVNNDNGFLIDTELFFTKDGFMYLQEQVEINFGIRLPDKANELHNIWYKWMEYAVNNAI